ncbi:MAG TPA: flagellar assembly peptidoglycan hydrolase FlgJ [Ramlibacter sp.]|jgi:flagellar protein FlgJ|uniref:flagellar assembly peptidoglycan hydrolase FlgJ n=1 Tax=Ramlibacter sp. TaxID=1917967 RepID=UPI002D5F83EB|nr:flagellar assembly peptidoglycan hydrolase FlgJ [Ramlibacter sp.]HZY18565.1 flagellar assembly peptidoglycan hydrolase FlgJ [Ramlibacter sp.]
MRTDPNAVSLDARSLDALRNQAAANPKAAAHQAAVQFESLFMQMVVKSMRDASPKADPAAGGGADTFTGMLDAQFSRQFAGRPGGLADMLEKQLTRHMQNLPAASADSQAQEMPPGVQPAAAGAPSPSNVPTQHAGPQRAVPAASAAGAPVTPAAARAAQASQAATVARAAGGTAPAQGLGSRAAAFIRDMLPHAKEAERQTGVPASFILGQAALESGWGKGEIRNADGTPSFNLFGIKATSGWKGAATRVMTTEYEAGQATRQRAAFRSYGSYAEAFTDYARMLSSSPRYGNVVRGAGTAEAFAGGMQRAGYATDPQYATKLARTINHTLALQRALG